MKKLLFILSLSALSFQKAPALDYNGQETNGGNGYSAEFFKIFDWAVNSENFPCWASGLLKPMTEYHLSELRWKLVVRSEPEVLLDGKPVGAINQGGLSPLVVISEDGWKNASADQKKALVLHEIFFLVGFDDANYTYSSKILRCIDDLNLKNAQYKEAFLRCDEPFLRSVTEYSVRTLSAPIKSELLNSAISGPCAEGFKALQRNAFFNCDSNCQSQICEITNEVPVRPQPERTLKQLDFLETVLRSPENKGADLKNCGWKICGHPEIKSQLAPYTAIQKACELSIGSI